MAVQNIGAAVARALGDMALRRNVAQAHMPAHRHTGEFQRKLPAFHQFFGPKNWFYLGITMATVKVLHEFGHGLSCKHFGGECHELGFMFLVFTPCLYCNVSDAWMIESKWCRAAIGAAGVCVELFLASLATLLWWVPLSRTMLTRR